MDKQREDEICKVFEDVVKKHPDATADEGSLPDDMRFIPLEFWQAAQAAMQKDYALALEKIAKKPEIDKTEWFCEQCNCVYPTQSEGKIYQPCPVCKSAMKITSIDLRHIEELKQQLSAANQRIAKLEIDNTDLRKNIVESNIWLAESNAKNAKLEERIRVADTEAPVLWMFTDDLEKFKCSETFAQAYSIKVGSPDGLTEPLYLHAQIPAEVVGSFFAGIEASEGILKIE